MNPINLLRFLLRTPSFTEASRIRRLDGLQGHRLAPTAPSVAVFYAPRRRALSR